MAVTLHNVTDPWNKVEFHEIFHLIPDNCHVRIRCRNDSFPVVFVRDKLGIRKFVVMRQKTGLRLIEQASNTRSKT